MSFTLQRQRLLLCSANDRRGRLRCASAGGAWRLLLVEETQGTQHQGERLSLDHHEHHAPIPYKKSMHSMYLRQGAQHLIKCWIWIGLTAVPPVNPCCRLKRELLGLRHMSTVNWSLKTHLLEYIIPGSTTQTARRKQQPNTCQCVMGRSESKRGVRLNSC